MKVSVLILTISLVLSSACSYSKFVKTGSSYPPVPDSSEVKVIPWGNQSDYEVVGIAEIGESSLDTRLEEAKSIARENGGDAIAPKGIDVNDSDKGDVGYRLQSFLILRTKPRQIPRQPDLKPKASEPEVAAVPVKRDTYKSSTLPRATYRLLVEEYDTLKGEKFRGSLFPAKFFRMPRSIDRQVDGEKKLLLLQTKSGKRKLLLLVPVDRTELFKELIRMRERLNFVYTPVTVYKSRYPVLEFLDILD